VNTVTSWAYFVLASWRGVNVLKKDAAK